MTNYNFPRFNLKKQNRTKPNSAQCLCYGHLIKVVYPNETGGYNN